MAVSNYSGLTIRQPIGGIQFTKVTDSSADWGAVANNTYFYDQADKLIHYKDPLGNILEIFSLGLNSPGAVYGLFAQTGSSTPITNTTTETTLLNGGIGTLSVPANGFKVGDSFVAKLFGHISCVGTATIQIKVKSGSVLLADTGILALDVTTNQHWNFEVNFTIRSLGTIGFGSIVSAGGFNYIKNSGLNYEGENFVFLNNTTFDTTILNTLDITAQWNTNNAGNNIYSDYFVLNKIF
jgi:hypothetical protein